MPTYQYACTECGGQIEAVQKFTDEPLSVHETCGGRLRKVFSPVGIVFKGSGFYRTDSRSGSPSTASSGSSTAAASSDKPAGDGTGNAASASSSGDNASSSSSSSSSTSTASSSGEKVA